MNKITYENEYDEFLSKTDNGKKQLERSKQVKLFRDELDKEIEKEIIFNYKLEQERKRIDDENKYRLWVECCSDNQLP